jgi:anti-anti-sigma regulatory factor
MRSEALEITIESRNDVIWITLAVPFHTEQVPSMREKFMTLMEDGNRQFVIDLENIQAIDDGVVSSFFLNLLNTLRGKDGDMKFIFKNEVVHRSFAPYLNLFSVYPDASAVKMGGFLGMLRNRGRLLSKKTGVRLSRPVALLILIVLCGWFISLVFIIHLQNVRIRQQETELRDLTQWKQHSLFELTTLRERIKPMEQLGIIKTDSLNH